MKMRIIGFMLEFFMLFCLSGVAGAYQALWNVQFNTSSNSTQSGAAVWGSAGDHWNLFAEGGSHLLGPAVNGDPYLHATIGGPTSVINQPFNAFSNTQYAALMSGYFYYNGGGGTTVLTGFFPNTPVQVVFYSQSPYGGGTSVAYQVNGSSASFTGPMNQYLSSFSSPYNYVTVSGYTDSGGAVNLSYVCYQANSNGCIYLNGFQIKGSSGYSQSISWATYPSNLPVGKNQYFNALATSGLAVSYGVTTPATCYISGNYVYATAVGTCTILASQAGDNNTYFPAQNTAIPGLNMTVRRRRGMSKRKALA